MRGGQVALAVERRSSGCHRAPRSAACHTLGRGPYALQPAWRPTGSTQKDEKQTRGRYLCYRNPCGASSSRGIGLPKPGTPASRLTQHARPCKLMVTAGTASEWPKLRACTHCDPPLPPCSLRRGGCPTVHLELIGGSWQPACNAAAGLVFAAASQGSIRPMARLPCTCERMFARCCTRGALGTRCRAARPPPLRRRPLPAPCSQACHLTPMFRPPRQAV